MSDKIVSNENSSMPLSAVAIAIFICILFGGNQVASKIALQQFPPLLCAGLAFTLSSITLWIYAGVKSIPLQVPNGQIWRLHIISAILYICFNAIALIGLQFTLASRSSIFIAMHPFFVVVFSYLTPQKEKIGWRKWFSLSLILAGVLIVFSDRLVPSLGASLWGDSLILVASALLGLMILHLRHVTEYVSPVQATLWQMSLSLPFFWLTSFIFESPLAFPQFSDSWWGIIYMGLAVNAIAFVVRAELFRRYSASTISAFLFISPISGLWLSNWLLGDILTWTILLGGIMVAVGVFLVYRFN
jgi:drug/metabolite transporter (DMT)-like permease